MLKNNFIRLPLFIFVLVFFSSPALSKAVKLGRMSETNIGMNTPSFPTSPPTQKAECMRHKDCPIGLACVDTVCVDACLTLTCPVGQSCATGKCTPCPLGSVECGCELPGFANGKGECTNPCALYPCGGSTPQCNVIDLERFCVCTDTSCQNGQICNGTLCENCAAGQKCSCPSPSIANGSGGCTNPCADQPCPSTAPTCTQTGSSRTCTCTSTSCGGGNQCDGVSCSPCEVGESCNCGTNRQANGSGGCEVVDACAEIVCDGGKYCSSGRCLPCAEGEICGCTDGKKASGSGTCTSCGDFILAQGAIPIKEPKDLLPLLSKNPYDPISDKTLVFLNDVNGYDAIEGKRFAPDSFTNVKFYSANRYTASSECASLPKATFNLPLSSRYNGVIFDGVNISSSVLTFPSTNNVIKDATVTIGTLRGNVSFEGKSVLNIIYSTSDSTFNLKVIGDLDLNIGYSSTDSLHNTVIEVAKTGTLRLDTSRGQLNLRNSNLSVDGTLSFIGNRNFHIRLDSANIKVKGDFDCSKLSCSFELSNSTLSFENPIKIGTTGPSVLTSTGKYIFSLRSSTLMLNGGDFVVPSGSGFLSTSYSSSNNILMKGQTNIEILSKPDTTVFNLYGSSYTLQGDVVVTGSIPQTLLMYIYITDKTQVYIDGKFEGYPGKIYTFSSGGELYLSSKSKLGIGSILTDTGSVLNYAAGSQIELSFQCRQATTLGKITFDYRDHTSWTTFPANDFTAHCN